MLMPRRVKYRKQMRGRLKGKESRGVELAFGEYGLQALEACWLTARQIEAARRAIVRFLRQRGKYWIRVFPDKPVTRKPAETRMGKGKGNVDHWVAVVRPGRIIFEIGGVGTDIAHEALRQASHKLPIRTQIIASEES
ncbi:MAG: 50S ribosomal protein L16 [Anaerolineae bacterium]|nr:50S ribosomal protein L16 [Thermoflexus sp.]MDW8065009.1 50S ribosomal protein L16 [Anaerolineae bacterium]